MFKALIATLMMFPALLMADQPGVYPDSAGKWINIDGTVKNQSAPVCAMVLANGQHMFSCGPQAKYSLRIPLDTNGQYKLMVFAEGHLPVTEYFDEYSPTNDVQMGKPAACIPNIRGRSEGWTFGNLMDDSGFDTVIDTETYIVNVNKLAWFDGMVINGLVGDYEVWVSGHYVPAKTYTHPYSGTYVDVPGHGAWGRVAHGYNGTASPVQVDFLIPNRARYVKIVMVTGNVADITYVRLLESLEIID
jgi:hypothetical protein